MDLSWHVRSSLVKIAVWLLRVTGWYEHYWSHWRTMHGYVENKGLHILPTHYYSPIPNSKELLEEIWRDARTPLGIDLNIEAAMLWLNHLNDKFRTEFNAFPNDSTDVHRFYLNNGAYRSGDAQILYAILRHIKPRKIIEIGSGYSTLLISEAIRENHKEAHDYRCRFVAIEPYPPAILTPPPSELTALHESSLQKVDPNLFSSLQAGDVLFIDSSHVARVGSDVVYEYLSILPRLSPGVLIHIHDIFIPWEYPRQLVTEKHLFWNEQYLLQAFLIFNTEFEVVMPTHALWRLYPDWFSGNIDGFNTGNHFPSSFWIRRVADAQKATRATTRAQ